MAATRRLNKELNDIRSSDQNIFRSFIVDESNMLHWTAILCPDTAPYNKGGFKIDIVFPDEYPFKPPKIEFKTKIYHPNVDEKGQVCLPLISPENWKPATKSKEVLQALEALISSPDTEHFLRADLGEEYINDIETFMKSAEDFTKKHADKRPS